MELGDVGTEVNLAHNIGNKVNFGIGKPVYM